MKKNFMSIFIIINFLIFSKNLLAIDSAKINFTVKTQILKNDSYIITELNNNFYKINLINITNSSFYILIKYDNFVKIIHLNDKEKKIYFCKSLNKIKVFKIFNDKKIKIITYNDMKKEK